MSKLVKQRKPFEEWVQEIFYDLFRAAGVALSTMQLERVNRVAEKLAVRIRAESGLTAIKQMRTFQKAVVEAFDKLEKDVRRLEKKVEKFEEKQSKP